MTGERDAVGLEAVRARPAARVEAQQMQPTAALAQVISAYMQREHLTLQMMARRADLSLATVAALRSGTRGKRPHPDTLKKLAAAMGMSVSVLAGVIEDGAGDRAREHELLEQFRSLDNDGKVKVERYVHRLHARS